MRIKHTDPENFERRMRRGFLWLPKRIYAETRWLEFAVWEEKYFMRAGVYETRIPGRWLPVAWW